MLVYLKILS